MCSRCTIEAPYCLSPYAHNPNFSFSPNQAHLFFWACLSWTSQVSKWFWSFILISEAEPEPRLTWRREAVQFLHVNSHLSPGVSLSGSAVTSTQGTTNKLCSNVQFNLSNFSSTIASCRSHKAQKVARRVAACITEIFQPKSSQSDD